MSWTVLCDFDKTITTRDATDALLEAYALPEWLEIEESWKKGHIGSRVCMQQQVALIRATPEQVDALADSIQIDPYFKSFARDCQQNGVPLTVLSDGLDYVIKNVLKREGLSHLHVIASHFAHMGADRWTLTSPFANAACTSQQSTCKCIVAAQMRGIASANKILYIGDGRSDFCVSIEEADFVLAKDSLLTYCMQNDLPHRAFNHFAEAICMLHKLIEQNKPAPTFIYKEQSYA